MMDRHLEDRKGGSWLWMRLTTLSSKVIRVLLDSLTLLG